jgi:hypothetical protein
MIEVHDLDAVSFKPKGAGGSEALKSILNSRSLVAMIDTDTRLVCNKLTLSPDGLHLAVVFRHVVRQAPPPPSGFSWVRIYCLPTQRIVARVCKDQHRQLSCLAFSDDGELLALAFTTEIRIYGPDAATGERFAPLHSVRVKRPSASPSSTTAAGLYYMQFVPHEQPRRLFAIDYLLRALLVIDAADGSIQERYPLPDGSEGCVVSTAYATLVGQQDERTSAAAVFAVEVILENARRRQVHVFARTRRVPQRSEARPFLVANYCSVLSLGSRLILVSRNRKTCPSDRVVVGSAPLAVAPVRVLGSNGAVTITNEQIGATNLARDVQISADGTRVHVIRSYPEDDMAVGSTVTVWSLE